MIFFLSFPNTYHLFPTTYLFGGAGLRACVLVSFFYLILIGRCEENLAAAKRKGLANTDESCKMSGSQQTEGTCAALPKRRDEAIYLLSINLFPTPNTYSLPPIFSVGRNLFRLLFFGRGGSRTARVRSRCSNVSGFTIENYSQESQE